MTDIPVLQTGRTVPEGALDRSLARGIAWTGGAKWFTQALSWVSTLVVAHLLSPADYGLVGMATVYIGLVQLINEFGLGAAIVQQRHLSETQIARVGGVSVLLGVGLCALSVGLSGPIAAFFEEPAVRTILMVLSLSFVTTSFQVLPRSLLARDLKFRELARIDLLEALVNTTTTLSLAVLGAGYWALVAGPLVSSLVATTVALLSRPHRLELPRHVRGIVAPLSLGWHLVVSRVSWYAYSNADFAIVGHFLGKEALGYYTIGWTLASIPVDRVSALVGRVTPSIFAQVQNDPPALRRYLRLLTEGLSLATFPLAVGLSLLADQVVLVLLGEQWRPAIVPLRLLAAYAGLRSVATLFPQILIATGLSKQSMLYSLIAVLVLPPCFLVGIHWGTPGVALAWVIAYPLLTIPTFCRAALRAIGMSAAEFLAALRPAAMLVALMTLGVVGVRLSMPAHWSDPIQFAIAVLVGAAICAGFVAAGYRERIRVLMQLFRGRPA